MQRSRTPRAHLLLQYRRIVRQLSGLTFVGGQMSEYKSNHRVLLGECEAECYRAQTFDQARRSATKPSATPLTSAESLINSPIALNTVDYFSFTSPAILKPRLKSRKRNFWGTFLNLAKNQRHCDRLPHPKEKSPWRRI